MLDSKSELENLSGAKAIAGSNPPPSVSFQLITGELLLS